MLQWCYLLYNNINGLNDIQIDVKLENTLFKSSIVQQFLKQSHSTTDPSPGDITRRQYELSAAIYHIENASSTYMDWTVWTCNH